MSAATEKNRRCWVVWLVPPTLGGPVYALGRKGKATLKATEIQWYETVSDARYGLDLCGLGNPSLLKFRAIVSLEDRWRLLGLEAGAGKAVVK